jgi:hypothetical protein
MKIGKIPTGLNPILLKRLVEIRRAILEGFNPPRPVKNLSATAKAGGILVQFTRTDGDSYVIYRNTTPSLNGSTRFELNKVGNFTDEIGKSAEKRYYWVRAKKGNLESTITGPVNATTLAQAAEATLPPAIPAVDEPVYSELMGYPTEK